MPIANGTAFDSLGILRAGRALALPSRFAQPAGAVELIPPVAARYTGAMYPALGRMSMTVCYGFVSLPGVRASIQARRPQSVTQLLVAGKRRRRPSGAAVQKAVVVRRAAWPVIGTSNALQSGLRYFDHKHNYYAGTPRANPPSCYWCWQELGLLQVSHGWATITGARTGSLSDARTTPRVLGDRAHAAVQLA